VVQELPIQVVQAIIALQNNATSTININICW
jgi:hypothetical protein